MNIAILILAAGSSSRMGISKQLLPVKNTTLLGITIETALKTRADKIYCVLGANAKNIENSISNYNVETIFNPNYKDGLSSSIVAGISHINLQNFDAILFVLGDQPLVSSKYIDTLIATYTNHPEKIIASSYKNNVGVPTIIPKIYFNSLLKLKGDKGAKEFLNTQKENLVTLDNANLVDIDTKHQYEDYLNSFHFE